ncbi:MAG: glycosyl transferase [Sphingomonadaceae bacterium]|nr:glycosyl transferase [Sphingomonadaceae bacterium]|tara:strand:+ start:4542 stop:7025 length:2484 start_codon:yes stop_codon:yes gene_type:complete
MQDNPTQHRADLARTIGYDLLGPVVHRWLLGLEQHIAFFEEEDAAFLFCARAGVRIKELYEIYLEGRGRVLPDNSEIFWISRLALCKGLYNQVPERAASIIAQEYSNQPIRDVVKGLLRHDPARLAVGDLETRDLEAFANNFPGWLKSRSPLARSTLDYLNASSKAFTAQLDDLLGESEKAVLIDSGWQGTGQSLLHHAHKNIDWHGLYFGRILTSAHDRAITDRVIGLLFQNDVYDPDRPESAFVLHRHLIETLLEPNGPSIEEIVGGPTDQKAREQIQANENALARPEHDSLYILVREYISNNASIDLTEIISRHQKAMPQLARILTMPTREEALSLFAKDRSADFGKDLEVPVLFRETEAKKLPGWLQTRDDRIQHSLWPQGQIALEFEGKLRNDLQLRVCGLTDDVSYFDHNSETGANKNHEAEVAVANKPVVAIITRTKNRPLLLKRAAESVAQQKYSHYFWVIVNDGGDEDVVRGIINNCSVDRRCIRLVSNTKSVGMEAASNLGVCHVDSDYVIIHDDDDTLHPDFIKETVEFLESNAGRRYGGVITGTEYVSEEIRGDDVVIHSRVPYMDWVRNIQISELMAQNLFAPIAFIYRRELYDDIGGYNEALPVLGDWFFNLEFVLKADIKVLPRQLAYYHHRDHGDSSHSGVYSNSVIGGQSKHEEFASVCRNMFMRKYSRDTSIASGLIMAYFTQDLRNRIERRGQSLTEIGGGSRNSPGAFSSELDRVWLLSLVLDEKARRPLFSLKRMPRIALDASLVDLARIARKFDVKINPPDNFDEAAYLAQNPDVASVVRAGELTSGFEHYVLNGHLENRTRTGK